MTKRTVSRIWLIVLAGVLAFAPMVAAKATSKARPKDVTVTGTVTCSKYVYSKPDRKGFTAAEAIRMCISQGYDYVIVSGKNVYPLEGDRKELAKLAGIPFWRVAHAENLASAVSAALETSGRSLIEVDVTAIGPIPPYYPYNRRGAINKERDASVQ